MKLVALTLSSALAVMYAFGLSGGIVNTSGSLPKGLYWPSHTSQVVEFCPPEPWGKLALARGYRDRGSCPDGGSPLLKPIAAKSGDVVWIDSEGIMVNGVRLKNTAPREKDSAGREMEAYPAGRYVVQPDKVWVVSSYDARSFDSRYIGPVSVSLISGHYRPLWVGR